MLLKQNETELDASHIPELCASNCRRVRSELMDGLRPDVKQVTIDLSETEFLDCEGLSTLLAVRKRALQNGMGATVRLLNPGAAVHRLLKLTKMDRLFVIGPGQQIPPAKALAAELPDRKTSVPLPLVPAPELKTDEAGSNIASTAPATLL